MESARLEIRLRIGQGAFGFCLIISHKPLNGNKIHKPALGGYDIN